MKIGCTGSFFSQNDEIMHGGRRPPSELGILSFELCAKAHCELFSFELIL